jgi:beta-phosphoglucomutase
LTLFDVIVDGNDVSKSKPNPEVFIKAAKQMNLLPKNCVVVEDAPAGIIAALSANMKVIGIGKSNELHTANLVIENSKNLSIDLLNQI